MISARIKMNKLIFVFFLILNLQINILNGQMNMAAKHSEVFRYFLRQSLVTLQHGLKMTQSVTAVLSMITFHAAWLVRVYLLPWYYFRKKYCRPNTCNKCRSYLLRTGIENTNSQQLYFLCSTLAIYENCCQFQVEGPSLFTG